VNLGSNYGWGARRFGSKILSPDPIASDESRKKSLPDVGPFFGSVSIRVEAIALM
jgi:hypothetical protein